MNNFLRNFFILISICCIQTDAKCQWQIIYQDSNFYNMGVQFLNADTGFVVGVTWNPAIIPQGIILRTTDGGITWDSTYTGAGNFMIEFPSPNVGYTGGHDGSVMKTTDMGATWTTAQSFCCNDYSNGYFFNNDSGFVVLWQGNILKTSDGAGSWQAGPGIGGYSPFPGMGSIQFLDDSVGIIAAGYNGIYSRTNNGGNSWLSSSIDSGMFLNTIYMKDYNTGYAIGFFGKYSRTFDGGTTWTTPVSLCSFHLHDMVFFNDSVGFIVGGRDSDMNNTGVENGVILKTIDAGNSWTVVDSSYIGYLTSVIKVNNSTGYAAGGAGLVLKIDNGNSVSSTQSFYDELTWNIFPNPASEKLNINGFFPDDHYELRIQNTLGEMVFQTVTTSQVQIDIRSLRSGLYVVMLINGNGKSACKKFIKL